MSAAGDLFLHKGPAAEDAPIGKIAYTATQKFAEWDLALLLLWAKTVGTGQLLDQTQLSRKLLSIVSVCALVKRSGTRTG